MDSVLVVEGLQKNIRNKRIIDNLSFSVRRGEIFGFLGPNGSGKTTTIRLLTGMIKPTAGSVEIMGYDIQRQFTEAMRHLSAIVEHPALFGYMTGFQNLYQTVRTLGKPIDKEHIQWCIDTVELTDRIHEKVENYSLGMKQRLAIAQSLISSPELLILDEPTNGMDPSGIKDMRSLIKKLSKDHHITIVLSSHLLAEIQHLCDRVLIINDGKYVASGSVKELVNKNRMEFTLAINSEQVDAAFAMMSGKGIETFKQKNSLTVCCQEHEIPHFINDLYEQQIYVYELVRKEYSLEEYFLSVTREVG